MARKIREKVRVQFDEVEKQLLAKVKAIRPEYEDLDLNQVARMELRYRLFEEIRKVKNTAQQPPHNSPVVWQMNKSHTEIFPKNQAMV